MWKVKSKKMIYGSFGMGLSFLIVMHMLVYFLLFGEESGYFTLPVSKIVPLFTAFDRVIYLKIYPNI